MVRGGRLLAAATGALLVLVQAASQPLVTDGGPISRARRPILVYDSLAAESKRVRNLGMGPAGSGSRERHWHWRQGLAGKQLVGCGRRQPHG